MYLINVFWINYSKNKNPYAKQIKGNFQYIIKKCVCGIFIWHILFRPFDFIINVCKFVQHIFNWNRFRMFNTLLINISAFIELIIQKDFFFLQSNF